MSDYGASDYYIAQIQRLEADRDFWKSHSNFWSSKEAEGVYKIAQLEADLRKARAELDAMNKWQEMVEVELGGVKLYVDTDLVPDAPINGVYCEPGQNLEDVLSPEQFNSICGQIDDMAEQSAADDAEDDRIYRSGDHA